MSQRLPLAPRSKPVTQSGGEWGSRDRARLPANAAWKMRPCRYNCAILREELIMPSGPLSIEVVDGNRAGEIILRLAGPLVLDNLFNFQNLWRSQTAPNIVVDLTGVPYVDSSGIGSLVNMHVSRQKVGGSVQLLGVSDRVKTVLAVTKVDKVLAVGA